MSADLPRAGEAPHAQLHAMLVCDQVIKGEASKKASVIGVFDKILAVAFPASHANLMVYVSVTDAEGQYRALAIAEGVDEALLAQWLISAPELPARSERAVQDNARKAWRFVGEMEEIARSFAQAGLPGGFHEAAGEVYRGLAGYKDGPTSPRVEEAIAALLKRPPRESP